MQKARPNYYSGTSGLVLPVPNKSLYPPVFQDKSRLCYYASLFNSIEVNSSFYKVPQASTVKKWVDDVPDNFTFTYKLWRDITHNKPLLFNPADVERFMQVVDAAGNKKGSLLIQLPPGTTIADASQLEQLLESIRDASPTHGWDIAVEFRHSSWYKDNIYTMLDNYSAGMVVQDMPKSLTPMVDIPTDFVYLRFHGPNGGYRGSYTDAFLYEYAGYINDWLAEGKRVYAYFNNTMGDAINNLMTLNSYVSEL
ncbi:MAG: DUF72 domain-containing protein [Mucilaginibacter sp.]|jgi:uncharacterized protein YecE (DUF72 family)|uniref:DUF72 domain-containing protein n=1 Tax=Mucilaginibacter sp. TaxID=1882438 RepID=UPI00356AFC51